MVIAADQCQRSRRECHTKEPDPPNPGWTSCFVQMAEISYIASTNLQTPFTLGIGRGVSRGIAHVIFHIRRRKKPRRALGYQREGVALWNQPRRVSLQEWWSRSLAVATCDALEISTRHHRWMAVRYVDPVASNLFGWSC